MIRYFIRHYWRYLAMALAFATISFLLGSCNVNAQESQIQTIQFGNWIQASANQSTTYTIYQKSVANAPLKNFGRSFLQFNVILYSTSGSTDTLVPSLREINVQSTGNMYTCNLGSVSQSYSIGTTYKANLYSVLCDVNLGANGLQMVELEVTNSQNYPFEILTSDYLTAIDNIDDNISGQIDSINANMGTYIGNLISSQNYGNDQLEAIKSMVNTNLTTIINKLEGLNIRLDSINTNLQTYIQNLIIAQNYGNDGIYDIRDKLNEIIEKNMVCKYIDKVNIVQNGRRLLNDGTITTDNNFGVTDWIKITKSTKITTLEHNEGAYTNRLCFYNINKTFISCSEPTTIGELTIPNNASYVRFSINKITNKPKFEYCDTAQNTQNQQNETIINQQNETNNTLKDSSTDDPTSDLEDMQENEISNSVISDLLLLPINMFQNILNAVNGTCSNFSLGALFGTTLVLPCINIENIIGSTLWGVIDVLFCGIFILSMRKKFVDIFENITSLKDRGNELE